MMNQSTKRQHRLTWVAVWIAALDCLVVAITFSLSQTNLPGNTFSDLWPTPALYFFELVALAVLSLFAVPNLFSQDSESWQSFPWIAAGIMLTFVVLGAFSIGLFLVPALLALMLIAVLAEARNDQYEPLNHFAYLLLSLFLLALVIIGTWSLGSSLTIVVLAAGVVLLLLAAPRLAQDTIWRNLSFFFIGGFSQTLMMYILLQPHL